jgi:hypothetical protein
VILFGFRHTLRLVSSQASGVSVEAIQDVLSYLVAERQQLRSDGATPAALEANRRAIVAMQTRLGRAFGERHAARRTPVVVR